MSEKKVCNFTFEEIKELLNIIDSKKIAKFSVKNELGELCIEGKEDNTISAAKSQVIVERLKSNMSDTVVVEKTEEPKPEKLSGNIIKSPIVGTFYSSPSPDKPPFVKVGQKVNIGDVLMIIESMKLMNEIQSDYEGTVTDVLVENGSAVEYDQPILVIN